MSAKASLVRVHGIERIYLSALPYDEDKIIGHVRPVERGGLLLEVNGWNLRDVKNNCRVSDGLLRIYNNMFVRKKVKSTFAVDIKHPLLPFQEEGVLAIERRRGKALLADDMGLGKTVQAIAWLTARRKFPCVVLCPSHLKYNWEVEFKKFAPQIETEVLSGETPYVPMCEQVLIVNYEILTHWADTLTELQPLCVIADEYHAVKNKSSKRAKACDAVMEVAKYRIGLTGTPMKTSTSDLWNQMRMIDANVLGGWSTFALEFCAAKKGYIFRRVGKRLIRTPIVDTSGTSQPNKLNNILVRTYMIRRTKQDVELELPKKVRSIIPVDPGKYKKQIEALEKKVVKNYEDGDSKQVMSSFSGLRIESGRVKIATGIVWQWIDNYLERADKPLIVVCWHRAAVADVIYERYKDKAVRITGAENAKQKHKAATKFQKGKARLLVCNVQSAGTGLTLTKTDTMLFVELPVDSADLEQMEDRICRISQEAKTVHYYYIVIRNTIEQRVIEIVDEKKTNTSLVIDGKRVNMPDLLRCVAVKS